MRENTECDYTNFDNLHVTVKKEKLEQLSAGYAALGWENAGQKEDKLYYDLVHISYRRPHGIKNKDELQLLQVYLETSWNNIGRVEATPCPKTLMLGLTAGILIFSALLIGLCFIFLTDTKVLFIWGCALTATGVILTIFATVALVKLHKKEKETAKKILKEAEETITVSMKKAASLTSETGAEAKDEI